jgi:dihydrolipoamide dehydrogenase
MESFDLIVIGAGPGGYVAALRAAANGLKVAVIEKSKTLGGTCLNVGCIPSKALLHSTEYYERIAKEGSIHGIEAKELSYSLERMMQRKSEVVHSLTSGIEFLFSKRKIQWIQGEGKFLSPTEAKVGENTYTAKHFIIATGSEPSSLPFIHIDEERIVTSTGVLSLKEVPKSMVVIGAGVIGLELGSVYRRLGSDVHVVELLDRAIPTFDLEISKVCGQIFKKQGISFDFSHKVTKCERQGKQVYLEVMNAQGEIHTHTVDVVLVAIGRRPFTENLGLESLGIELSEQKTIPVNGSFQTSYSHIYAIGDVIDGPMLAHKAEEEGVLVADLIAGQSHSLNYLSIPNVMYTWPEVACVGLSEEEIKESKVDYIKASLPFKAVPRARASGDTEGVIKILACKKSKKILGLHLVGPNVSEMIGEGVLAIKKGLTLEDLAFASHAHPTCSEGIKEAAFAALGKPLNT